MAELPAVLLASSEVVGFAKTGGLADVSGYLPRARERRGSGSTGGSGLQKASAAGVLLTRLGAGRVGKAIGGA